MGWNNLSRCSALAAFLVGRKQLKARSCVLLLLGVGRAEGLRTPQKVCARETQGWKQQVKCCKRGFNFGGEV